jgi:ADP-ribosyl-[dinitrogen reductase] hydrolase
MPPTAVERYRGCLLGHAIGDALGAPLEFLSRAEVRVRYPAGLRDLVGGGTFGWAPGEYTDDTQMAVCLARSLVERKGFDPRAVAEAWLAWYRAGPRDVGSLVARSLGLVAQGEPWDRAGRLAWEESEARAAGNGGLMRCAPLALLYRDRPETLAWASRQSSAITHYDPRCQQAAAAYTLALASLLRGGGKAHALGVALDAIEHSELIGALTAIPALDEPRVHAGGYVVETLQAALWSFVHADALEDVVVLAANLGDEADTVGALAGALAGAHYGERAIPRRWLAAVQGRDELERLAEALLVLAGGRGTDASVVDTPPIGALWQEEFPDAI